MEESPERDSTIMNRLWALTLLIFCNCNSDSLEEPIPFASFDRIEINLSLPQYADLSSNGTFIYLNQGVRGIILYRESLSAYHAYERNCSYLPNEAGSTVEVHPSNLFMQDTFCGSTFEFSQGLPTGGPARVQLREYKTTLNGSLLTITEESVIGN